MALEPVMITLELDADRSVQIRRCCDAPTPMTRTTTFNHNTCMWQSVVFCLACRTELITMRWKLPAKQIRRSLDTVSTAYADAAHD